MGRVTLTIDDQKIQTWQGATILETALENKIFIPHLCYHPDLKPPGNCRICLVEVDKGRLVTSCRTRVKEGMAVKTKGPELDKVRLPIIEMVVANHHMDCRNCLKKRQCQLQKIMAYMKVDKKKIQEHLRLPKAVMPLDDSNPFFIRDHNKCVMCGICIQTCREIAKVNAIDFAGKGFRSKVSTFADKPIAESNCVSCGECVIRCPVGALALRNPRKAVSWVKSVCPYCGVGCGVQLGVRDEEIVDVKADASSPVNVGRLCVKGRFGMGFIHSPDRLKEPMIRQGKGITRSNESGKNSGLLTVPWDEALGHVADTLKNYKGREFALIASTKCTNEDNYIAQKFARVVMGSNNIDTPARLDYGPNITAFRRTGKCIGFNTSENGDEFSFAAKEDPDQLEQAACILVAGANITQSHPVLGLKIKKAIDAGARLIVISPNGTELCHSAEKWLNPYPGTDLALLMGMCNVIVEEELMDTAFLKMYCHNFEAFREAIDDFSLGRVERITGVPRELIEESARIYAFSKPGAIFWGPGITQYAHGTDNVYALINLAILTANIRYPFALKPLAEQNNTLGACDMGCLPNYYPCYQPVGVPDIQEKFEILWECSLNPNPGLTFTEIIDATLAGKIKALYIIGSNPALRIAPSKKVRAALKKAKFVVFQDLFMNETAEYASVVLPAASFAEKTGTYTNTDGKTQRLERALEPVGNSRPDWEILCQLAGRLHAKGFSFGNTDDILSEILTVIQNLPETIGSFSLVPLQYQSSAESTDMDYPLILTSESDLYADGVMSEKTLGLRQLGMKSCLSINPKDAADFEITDGETLRIVSRHGSVESKAFLTGSTPAGLAVMRQDQEKINALLNPALDAVSMTPEMKMCSVRLEKIKEIKKRQKRVSEKHA